MFGLLLKFLSAERNGDWQLYLETFEQMLFYDRAYDHLKCFKQETVYLIDMKRLTTKHADIHDAFMNDFNSVSRNQSLNKIKLVSTDMALGQSMNQDTKTKGGSYTT